MYCTCGRAWEADGRWPMSQTAVTITLQQSNTDLNQVKNNQRKGIAKIQEEIAREQCILLWRGDENGWMGTECSDEMRQIIRASYSPYPW